MKTCTSCNKVVTKNHIEFKCPNCGKNTIVRCASCKENAKIYACKECEFVGP
ncbi:MAG: zinc finger domain-containing protein [archaeon]